VNAESHDCVGFVIYRWSRTNRVFTGVMGAKLL
jgi:hypothetical protein